MKAGKEIVLFVFQLHWTNVDREKLLVCSIANVEILTCRCSTLHSCRK